MSGTISSRSIPMIKLAPSPRDPPSSTKTNNNQLSLSPRSFQQRSQEGSSSHHNNNNNNEHKKNISSPRSRKSSSSRTTTTTVIGGGTTKQRNKVEAAMANVFGDSSGGGDEGPEMSTRVLFSKKKKMLLVGSSSSPRATSTKQKKLQNNTISSPNSKNSNHRSTKTATNNNANANNSPAPTTNTITPKTKGGTSSNNKLATRPTITTSQQQPQHSSPHQPSSHQQPQQTTLPESKKILLIDPKSGQKYNLHADDHSLTDKELIVYHKKKKKKKSSSNIGNSNSSHTKKKKKLLDGSKSDGKNDGAANSGTSATATAAAKSAAVAHAAAHMQAAKAAASSSKQQQHRRSSTDGASSKSSSSSSSSSSTHETQRTKDTTADNNNNANNDNNGGGGANNNNNGNANNDDDDTQTLNTLSTPHNNEHSYSDQHSLGETLETASALTEVSYLNHHHSSSSHHCHGGRKGSRCILTSSGPWNCLLPTTTSSSGSMVNGLGCGLTPLDHHYNNTHHGRGVGGVVQEETTEGRDDVESIERGRYKHLLEVVPNNNKSANGGGMLRINTTKSGLTGTKSSGIGMGSNHHNGSKYDDGNNKVDSLGNECDNGDGWVGGDNNDNENGGGGGALLSPISALGSLLSPRISSTIKHFFSDNNNNPITSPKSTFGNYFLQPEDSNSNSTSNKVVEVKFRRTCLVVFPEEVRACLRGHGTHGRYSNTKTTVGLLGMRFVQDSNDFQGHVSHVQRGSRADRMGVRRGDVVSFAVALSNMTEEQNSFLAEKLIKRLESVGMRTSYRELFDIFLSKTTNGRPIGMVFRRWKNRGGANNVTMNMNSSSSNGGGGGGAGSPMNLAQITNEFEWSTDFLQGLSIKCREYEFEQKVPLLSSGSNLDNNNDSNNNMKGHDPFEEAEMKMKKKKAEEEDEKDLAIMLSFLPRPNVDTSPNSTSLVSEYLSSMLNNLTMIKYGDGIGKCMDSTCGGGDFNNSNHTTQQGGGVGGPPSTNQSMLQQNNNYFLSNRILCSLVEQSMGLIFLRRTSSSSPHSENKATCGSGFAVVRKAEGSWSAPCFLSILGSKDSFTEQQKKKQDGSSSPSSSYSTTTTTNDVKIIVIRKKELVNNLILGNAVKFSVRKEERANVLVRDAAIIGVEEGRFRLANDFFLAVKVNDVQNQGAYSMSTDYIEASDILTGTISPPEQSVDFYGALQSLELPYSMHSHPVIPEMLQRYSDSDWVEFLPDQQSAGGGASAGGMRTKLELISNKSSLEDKREIDIFARKFKYYLMDGVPVHRVLPSNDNPGLTEEKVLRLTIRDPKSLFTSSLELTRKRRPGVSNAGMPSNFSTTFENITKLSRTPPPGATKLDEEEMKRFFSIETDLSPGPVMMLAKSKKDAMILLCGLKLLLEREKMLSY